MIFAEEQIRDGLERSLTQTPLAECFHSSPFDEQSLPSAPGAVILQVSSKSVSSKQERFALKRCDCHAILASHFINPVRCFYEIQVQRMGTRWQ
jgi:hypothetical protein